MEATAKKSRDQAAWLSAILFIALVAQVIFLGYSIATTLILCAFTCMFGMFLAYDGLISEEEKK